ncbi:MAG: ABC transporter permease [Candidatus Desulforudis sp.]|nr:ABC transporter permease [Desulforudis sp.]MBV1736299.1 ABC transporter permease [Desulforudis sp.]MBV1769230.1 ABC transporter permease [Desulforudis sp.]
MISRDPAMMHIIWMSLFVSGISVFLASALGIPLGTWLGLLPAHRVRWAAQIIYTLMGLPPVLAGLLIYLLLSSSGPFGVLKLLYTPWAMVVAQTVLAFPIVTGLTMIAVRSKDKEIRDTAVSLGASAWQSALTIVREARLAIVGAVVTGLGRLMAEVGAVMMVGGNIEGKTRVMTSAIVLETRRGNFEMAIGLGIVLLVLAFIINSCLYRLQGVPRN